MQRSSVHFTFRQLRNFRFFFLTQEFVNKNLIKTSENFQTQDTDKLESSKSTYQINYSIFGNGEAISPAQRRRFRESQKASTNPQKRKLSLFPTKRSKRIYSFSALQPIQSFFDGTRRHIRIYEKINNVSENKLGVGIISHSSFKKARSQAIMLQSIFQFSPSYFFGNILYTKQKSVEICSTIFVSFFVWKKIESICLEKETIIEEYSAFLAVFDAYIEPVHFLPTIIESAQFL